jgi:hypothetical protein
MFALDGNSYITKWQPRPQGLPRGGARAEEDPSSFPGLLGLRQRRQPRSPGNEDEEDPGKIR